jgi:RHS repeat-associated protein
MRVFFTFFLFYTALYSETLSFLEKTYDLEGNCIEKIETDQEQNVIHKVQWEYDSFSNITKTLENEKKITLYTYTRSGKLETITKPDLVVLFYEYDKLGRNSRQYSSDQSVDYTYIYNLNDDLISSTDNINDFQTTREVDGKGRVIKDTLANGLVLEKEYDTLGRQTLLTLPDNSAIEYVYDAFYLRYVNRISKEEELLYSHHYKTYDLSENLIEEIFFSEEVSSIYSYDLCQQKNKIVNPYLAQTVHSRDKGARIAHLSTDSSIEKDQKTFSYDNLNHLTEETGLNSHCYAYDNKHNRISKDNQDYIVNDLNQIIGTENTQYSYDTNGNLIQIATIRQNTLLHYDALDRLIAVECEDTFTLHYTYDHLHRRVKEKAIFYKEDGFSSEETYLYIYDQTLEIGKTTEDQTIKELRVLGNTPRMELGAAISIEIDEKPYIPFHDLFCNLTILLEPKTNTIAESYSITSFGEMQTFGSSITPINPWRYCSKRSCPLTGFVFFGRRYYSPSLGRFISCDPSGFTDSYNLYCFVFNNPLSYFDPDGLESVLFPHFNNYSQGLPDYSQDFPKSYNNPVEFNPLKWDIKPPSIPNIDIENNDFLRALPRDHHKFSYSYDLKKPEPPNGRIGFINGINTLESESRSHMNYISDLSGGTNVYGVYNRTRGTIYDLAQSVGQLSFNMASKSTFDQMNTWSNFFKQNKKDPYLHFCHSQGAIITRNALRWMPKEQRNRIIVVAIAPAAYINKNLCKKVYHYRSKNDLVPKIDYIGRYRCRDTTTVLKPHKDAQGMDHSFQSPTYRDIIDGHIRKYLKSLER